MADYFVKVDDGKELRKQILESSKLCIHVLKQEHKVMEIRRRKVTMIARVREELKELTFLLGSLEKDLPALTKKELEELNPAAFKRRMAKKKAKKSAKKETTPVVAGKNTPNVSQTRHHDETAQELSKLERLERSLKLIEGRLSDL